MKIFNRQATQQPTKTEEQLYEEVFQDSFMVGETTISNNTVMEIPVVNSSVTLIKNIVAGLNFRLYKENDEIVDDDRLLLLNYENNDLLSVTDFRSALIQDYFTYGNGYAYIERKGNKVIALKYVSAKYVSVVDSYNPINKDAKILVNGEEFESYDFVCVCRNSKNGVEGQSIVDELSTTLKTNKAINNYTLQTVEKGGLLSGIIESSKKLNAKILEGIKALKKAWNNKFKTGEGDNFLVLDEGLTFKSVSSNSKDMQIAEMKEIIDKELMTIFNVNEGILSGKASHDEYVNFISITILPLLNILESAFNKSLLLEKEKRKKYRFSINADEILKADIESRYRAYEIGINRGFLNRNEVRVMEGNEPVEGLDTFVMSLGNVLFNPKTQSYVIPNTGSTITKDQVENPQNIQNNNIEA